MKFIKLVVHRNKRFQVVKATRRLTPTEACQYWFVSKPNAVGVVVYTQTGGIVLATTDRIAIGRQTVEIIGGRIEKGESPLKAARREVLEETSTRAKTIRLLGRYFPLPSVTNELVTLYAAQVDRGEINWKCDKERLSLRSYSRLEVRHLLADNAITSAVDALALSIYLRL